jgi:hypothetical protein
LVGEDVSACHVHVLLPQNLQTPLTGQCLALCTATPARLACLLQSADPPHAALDRLSYSQGADRVVLWDELERFRELPLFVSFINADDGKPSAQAMQLDSCDAESGSSVWRLADVRANSPGACFLPHWLRKQLRCVQWSGCPADKQVVSKPQHAHNARVRDKLDTGPVCVRG